MVLAKVARIAGGLLFVVVALAFLFAEGRTR